VEDTYYSDTPDLDSGSIRRGLDEYIQARSWQTRGAAQEESGVLPIVLSGDIEAFWNEGPEGVARSGMRAALFHPTTGYSLPEAVRLADDLVGLESLAAGHLARWTRRRSESLWRSTGYFRLLNRMLFRAADPDQRYRVLERFYRLGEPLIRRFYAGRLRWTDKIRLVTGSPPVPIGRALKCVLDRRPRPTSDAP
jgi:lycopene beta-cyclase